MKEHNRVSISSSVDSGDRQNGIRTISGNDVHEHHPRPKSLSLKEPGLDYALRRKRSSIGSFLVGGKDVTHPTSYMETLIHILKANIGSGLFAMGDAFKNSGLIAGPIFTVAIGLICIYAQHELLEASMEVAKRMHLTYAPDYPEAVELSIQLGPPCIQKHATFGRRLCNVFLCITQIGFCSVYFVFVGTNLKEVMDAFGLELDPHLWMLAVLPPILLLSWVRNLKHLTPASLVSNMLMLAGISITIFMCVRNGLPSLDSRPAIVKDLSRLPLYFGTAVYCFEAISLIIPLRNEMKNPKQFGSTFGVLNIGVGITCAILTAVGFISYLKFGDDVKGSITLNMDRTEIVYQDNVPKLPWFHQYAAYKSNTYGSPVGPIVFPMGTATLRQHSDLTPSLTILTPSFIALRLTNVLQLSLSLAVIMTFPIQAYVPIQLIWPAVDEKWNPKHPVLAETLVRTLIVLLTLILAETVPRLELFISLVGAVSSSGLAIIFPPMMNLFVYWNSGRNPIHHACNVAIILFGILGCVVGTYTTVYEIVQAFMRGDMS